MAEGRTQSSDARTNARAAARRPRWALLGAALVILGWLVVGGLGGQAQGRLSGVQSNDNATFLPENAESTLVSHAVEGFSDSTELPYLVVVDKQGGGSLGQADLAAVQQFAEQVPDLALPGIGEDATLGDYLEDTAVTPVPSEDGEAVLISVPLDGEQGTEAAGETTALAEGATALREAIGETLEPAGLQGYVGGPGGLIADFSEAFAGIDGILLLVALVVVLVILLVVYRSPVLPLAVLVSAVLGLSAASLVVYQLAKSDVITLSGQSQGILFILVVGAATDYALLLVSRFKEALHDEPSAWTALVRAWRGAVEPIGASAATVILGLLCLLFAQLRSTSGLGPVGALGIAGALLASLTFLPAVLLLFGRKIFWPFAPRVDHEHAEDVVGSATGLWGRVARMVGSHPRRTWGTTLVVLLAAAAFVPQFRASGATIEETFLTDVDSITAQEVLGEHFAAGAAQPLQVVVPEGDADAALGVVTGDPGIETAYLGLTPPQPGQEQQPPTVVDGDVLVQATTTDSADSEGAEDTVERLRESLDAVSTDALVGGNAAANLDVLDASSRDLRVLVPTILGVIFVVLALLLRSLLAPLVLVVGNVVSFAATIGVSALVFDHVLGFTGGDPAIPLYGFVFLVALGIDYSIFLMTRVREESLARGTRTGVLVGLAVTGGVITSAGIVLAATFSALAVLPIQFLVQIAFIVGFGVLLDTFVVRSLLVPAVAHDLGPRVWWPARLVADGGRSGPGRHADGPHPPADPPPAP
ncbi:MMPL family transporter [Phycicoccus endophyticus]|uniref:MMPL family transporter n=1 Tax=Phycicoccus endophyticus TaxID=1690220 RepID=A0A7G9R519_9MICO|nr:MMPL family transporter [Phycicoccus endophyticus]NHI20879.1 MMPL family transporter [Phycicoccus endophyticus]QNN50694.1 MMPL family transporter [Phycicoccus endophyticus]GGL22224.1 RND superfamily drug exporter [Phycicoccus endophyticus]